MHIKRGINVVGNRKNVRIRLFSREFFREWTAQSLEERMLMGN
jgi:hypothetical protein